MDRTSVVLTVIAVLIVVIVSSTVAYREGKNSTQNERHGSVPTATESSSAVTVSNAATPYPTEDWNRYATPDPNVTPPAPLTLEGARYEYRAWPQLTGEILASWCLPESDCSPSDFEVTGSSARLQVDKCVTLNLPEGVYHAYFLYKYWGPRITELCYTPTAYYERGIVAPPVELTPPPTR